MANPDVERIIEALLSVFTGDSSKQRQEKKAASPELINQEKQYETKNEQQVETTTGKGEKETGDNKQATNENVKTKDFFRNCLDSISKNGMLLQCLSDKYRIPSVCSVAVQANGSALQFVPENLKTLQICLLAVKQDKQALKFVPKKLRATCQTQIDLDKVLRNERVSPVGKTVSSLREMFSKFRPSKLNLFGRGNSKFRDREQSLIAYLQDGSCFNKIPDQHKKYVKSQAKKFSSALANVKSSDDLAAVIRQFPRVANSMITIETLLPMLQTFGEANAQKSDKQEQRFKPEQKQEVKVEHKQEVKSEIKPDINIDKQIRLNIDQYLLAQTTQPTVDNTPKRAI